MTAKGGPVTSRALNMKLRWLAQYEREAEVFQEARKYARARLATAKECVSGPHKDEEAEEMAKWELEQA